MNYKTIVLIDGENLVFRYQEMINKGRKKKKDVIHKNDSFVWIKNVLKEYANDLVRVSYYTTVTGDDKKVENIIEEISNAEYDFNCLNGSYWSGTLVPHVYKKHKKTSKTKSVDINLTIDALRYAYGNTIDKIIIMSGDVDYIPLLREIMAKGKMVQVYAFSDGLNKDMLFNVDDLTILDKYFFE